MLRSGQLVFNALFEVAPEIANTIRGSKDDPFYNNDIIPAFMKRVIELAQLEKIT